MNKQLFSGYVAGDVEVKESAKGNKYCNICIGVKGVEKGLFLYFTAFNKQAEYIDKYISKGDYISVESYMTVNLNPKTNKNETQYMLTNVELLSKRKVKEE